MIATHSRAGGISCWWLGSLGGFMSSNPQVHSGCISDFLTPWGRATVNVKAFGVTFGVCVVVERKEEKMVVWRIVNFLQWIIWRMFDTMLIIINILIINLVWHYNRASIFLKKLFFCYRTTSYISKKKKKEAWLVIQFPLILCFSWNMGSS